MKRLRIPMMTCSFQVTGLNLEKLCRTLTDEGMPLLKAKRQGVKTMDCRCYESDLPAIRELAASKGWSISRVRPERLSRWAHRLKTRPGLWIGAALMAVLLIVSSQFVWRVEIQGAGRYQPDMAQFLSEQGVQRGAQAGKLDLPKLVQQLYFRYPAFSWFTATRRGMTVEIRCRMGVVQSGGDEQEGQPLVALCDGLIERVETHAGTAKVAAGQLVREGDVLIEGIERTADEQTRAVAARGIVTARCWAQSRVSVPAYEWLSSQTGRETTYQQIVTPLYCLPGELETPEYLSYDTEIRLLPIGGAFFPVTLKTLVYREVALEARERELEIVKKEAETAALRKLDALIKSDEIVDKWVDYCMIESGELLAIATAELRRNIAVPK